MFTDTETISFLPELDDIEFKGLLVARDWEEAMPNDCDVLVHGVHRYNAGKSYNTTGRLEVEIGKVGKFLYFSFTYDFCDYCHGSPLAVGFSDYVNRNNKPEFVADAIGSTLSTRLASDRNLDKAGKNAIMKLYTKIKPEIIKEL